MKLPSDRAAPPNEADLFLLGRTDSAVAPTQIAPLTPGPTGRPIGEPYPPPPVVAPTPPPAGGMALLDPSKLEKDYGHAY